MPHSDRSQHTEIISLTDILTQGDDSSDWLVKLTSPSLSYLGCRSTVHLPTVRQDYNHAIKREKRFNRSS